MMTNEDLDAIDRQTSGQVATDGASLAVIQTLTASDASCDAAWMAQEVVSAEVYAAEKARADAAESALVGLMDVVAPLLDPRQTDGYAKERGDCRRLFALVSTTALAARVRARVLREAAERLRALADEAEKSK